MTDAVEVTLSFKGDVSDPNVRAFMDALLAAAAQHGHVAAPAPAPEAGQEELMEFIRKATTKSRPRRSAERLWRAIVRAVRALEGASDLDADDDVQTTRLSGSSLKQLLYRPDVFEVTRISEENQAIALAFIKSL